MKNDEIFSETEDTKLKKFLSGGRIYSQLAVAIISGLVFVLTVIGMINVYSNCKEAENICDLSGLNVSGDLNGQYVQGSAYKFLAKLGHIAESEKAATYFYYLMYTDGADGEQYLTLVEAPRDMDSAIQQVISSFLSYAQDPEGGYIGSAFEDLSGRFKNMDSSEASPFSQGISTLNLSKMKKLDYTLKLGPLPKKSDTVGYWFVAIPFGAALVVSVILFIYGLKLEEKRAKANESPYPYYQKRNKK